MNLPKLQAMLDAAEARIKTSGGLSHEDVWNSVTQEAPPEMADLECASTVRTPDDPRAG